MTTRPSGTSREILKEFGIRQVTEASNGFETLNEIAGEPPTALSVQIRSAIRLDAASADSV